MPTTRKPLKLYHDAIVALCENVFGNPFTAHFRFDDDDDLVYQLTHCRDTRVDPSMHRKVNGPIVNTNNVSINTWTRAGQLVVMLTKYVLL